MYDDNESFDATDCDDDVVPAGVEEELRADQLERLSEAGF